MNQREFSLRYRELKRFTKTRALIDALEVRVSNAGAEFLIDHEHLTIEIVPSSGGPQHDN